MPLYYGGRLYLCPPPCFLLKEEKMIGVYNITFYKYDEDGNEVLNEDGSVKIFTLKPTIRFKPLEYLCEDLTDDLVIEEE
jgi:hypothetical protein